MATLNLIYDTGPVTLADLNDSLAVEWSYQATINGQPNPETKAQFNRRKVAEKLREAYRNGKRKIAAETAEQTLPDVILT